MKKPPILYHASGSNNIEIFEPRRESFRDVNEGPVVFATANKVYALMFLVKTDDSWTRLGFFNDQPYFVCSDKERFLSSDHGGSIYELPSDSFTFDLEKGGKIRQEYTSNVAVRPIGKEDYNSGLKAMIDMGVKVYFVDESTFKEICNAGDNGFSILNKLTQEKLSE